MLNRIKNKIINGYRDTFIFPLVTPRKTHIYCLGTAKSGTHSIEALFGDKLRCAHEPEGSKLIEKILANASGHIDEAEIDSFLLQRDRKLWLDVDSSQLNFFFLNRLTELFPNAKFILTIRNPYSWLDSFINHQLASTPTDIWAKMRDFRFRPDVYTHHPEESVLRENGLYTLDGYLKYWGYHNRTVIDTAPEDRLLIVRTDKITEQAEEIAAFAGVSSNSIKKEKSHAFKSNKKFEVLEKIDQEYLENKVMEHCSELITRFFPEIKSRQDS